MALIGTNMSVAVQSTLGSALPVTVLTKASAGVATSTAHGLNDGDFVVFVVTDGMVELDGQVARVSSKTTDTITLESVNTTNYSTWTTGNMYKITAFSTLSSAQQVTMPNAAPAKIDITRLIDVVKQYTYGLPDAPDGSVACLFNPGGTAEGLIITATNNNARMVFKISWAGGQKTIFNANVSGGAGFDLQTNDAAKATIAFTPVAKVIHYAS